MILQRPRRACFVHVRMEIRVLTRQANASRGNSVQSHPEERRLLQMLSSIITSPQPCPPHASEACVDDQINPQQHASIGSSPDQAVVRNSELIREQGTVSQTLVGDGLNSHEGAGTHGRIFSTMKQQGGGGVEGGEGG